MYTALDYIRALKIVDHVEHVINVALKVFAQGENWESRTGGYFCLADGLNGIPYIILRVGDVPEEKAEKYFSLCQEKARRLTKHLDHMSSWQSRVPDQEKWGGAVRMHDSILSFSGLPELGDEAIMLGTRCLMDRSWSGQQVANAIAVYSKNAYWLPLLQALQI